MPQFILSENLRNDVFASEMHELKDYFSSKKQLLYSIEPQKTLNILSETLKSTFIFLYDHEFLTQTYPEGIITENLLLIPVEQFESLRKNFSTLKKEHISNNVYSWTQFFINPLIKNLELKLDVTIPKHESQLLSKKILDNIKPGTDLSEDKQELNFTVMKNKTLLESIKNQDITLIDFLKNSLDSEQDEKTYVQYWLKKNPDLLENLPSLATSLENIVPVSSVNIDELKENLHNFTKSSSFQTIYQIYQIVDNMKEQTGNDKKAFIENSSNTLIPLLYLSDEFVFSSALQYIKENIFSKDNSVQTNYLLKANNEFISDFCTELNTVCYNNKRDIMIKIMTDYNLFNSLHLSGDELLKKAILATKNTNSNTKHKM